MCSPFVTSRPTIVDKSNRSSHSYRSVRSILTSIFYHHKCTEIIRKNSRPTEYLRSPRTNVGFPVGENIRRIRSMSHNIDNSLAFFKMPFLLFEYVICRLLVLSNLFIFSLTLPILQTTRYQKYLRPLKHSYL